MIAERFAVAVTSALGVREERLCALHAERRGSPTQHPLWLRACLGTIARGNEVRLVTAGIGSSWAVAPLMRRNGGNFLEMAGVAELYEPMDFLYSDDSVIPELVEALAGLEAPLFLRRLPADSPVVPALRDAYKKRGLVMCRPVAGCPWIPLNPAWRQPETQLRPSRASDCRRAQRIASAMGTVSYDFLSPAPRALEAPLQEAFDVESRSWKGRIGSDLTHDPLRGPFYRACASLAAERGILRLSFMRIGGRPAAMQIGAECGNRYWLLKSSYDEDFARCSPGNLLLLESLRRASNHLSSYEFLGTAERWTRVWTSRVHPCVSVRAYPERVSGIAALATEAARTSLKKVGQLVRPVT